MEKWEKVFKKKKKKKKESNREAVWNEQRKFNVRNKELSKNKGNIPTVPNL